MRRLIAFPCQGETLIGSLDEAAGATGLLIVSGGNEIRAGAHRGMATLAATIAAAGFPVFRFDRRGVGDSSGENRGFGESGPDIAAAAAVLRAETGAACLVGFGNCDAASALASFGLVAGIDAVILANPWVVEPIDDLPPTAAIRARYAARLRDPAAIGRLVTGRVSIGKLARGLGRLAAPDAVSSPILSAISDWRGDVTVVLAAGDATALAYSAAAHGLDASTVRLPTASHSFADTPDLLAETILDLVRST